MKPTNKTVLYGLPTMMQIRADRVIGYHSFQHSKQHLSFLRSRMSSDKIRKRAYSGHLSYGARKRLTKACQILACVSPQRRLAHPVNQGFFNFRLAFLTLTFPIDLTPDQERTAPTVFLKPLIQHLIRKHGIINYVWKAELTKTNRLHFHILLDQPINYLHLRNYWNKLLRKARLLDNFAKENGHYNANSTDIRKVKSLQQALKYTSKYISKGDRSKRGVLCKIWDSSVFLKTANWSALDVGQEVWFEVIKDLTGREDGVYLQERFFVVANRYLKKVSSLKSFLLHEVAEWVHKMRVQCGWIAEEFADMFVSDEVPIVKQEVVRVNKFENDQLQFLFPILR